MTVKELEERVLALEMRVQQLSSEIGETKDKPNRSWLRSIEKFAGDKDLLSIFADAQKLREADRQKARRKASSRASRKK